MTDKAIRNAEADIYHWFALGSLGFHEAIEELVRLGNDFAESVRMVNEWADDLEADEDNGEYQ